MLPTIKKDPKGSLLSKASLFMRKIIHPIRELTSNIKLSDTGPKILPIAPNKIKSPPPIPSFFRNNL